MFLVEHYIMFHFKMEMRCISGVICCLVVPKSYLLVRVDLFTRHLHQAPYSPPIIVHFCLCPCSLSLAHWCSKTECFPHIYLNTAVIKKTHTHMQALQEAKDCIFWYYNETFNLFLHFLSDCITFSRDQTSNANVRVKMVKLQALNSECPQIALCLHSEVHQNLQQTVENNRKKAWVNKK